MFFSSILPLLFLLGVAFSLPIDLAPQAVPAETYLPRLVSVLGRMDSALKVIPAGGSFEEASGRTNDLINMQMEYENILHSGAAAVRAGQGMLPPDGMRMIPTLQEIKRLLDSASTGWIRAKQMVVAAGKKNEVYQQLIMASDSTSIFGDAFVAKMPPAAQTVGKSFSKACKGYLEGAIKVYKT
jgi:hypothetical protein